MAGFDTNRVQAGYDPREHHNATNLPIYATASFEYNSMEQAERIKYKEAPGMTYSRLANPTVLALEQRLAALDGAKGQLALGTGMAAVSFTALGLTGGKGNIVISPALYGGTVEAFSHFLPSFGVTGKLVEDRFDPASYEAAIDDDTKAVWVESITNPNAELTDIEAIAEIAHRHGIPLVVDNTIATPYLFKPFEHGADIVVYSATKGICGHGSALGGAVLEKGGFRYSPEKYPQFYQKLTKIRNRKQQPRAISQVAPAIPLTVYLRLFFLEYFGAGLAPFEAYLIFQGLSTISERLAKQSATAEKLAAFLETAPGVSWVSYPTVKGSPFATLKERYFEKGAGGVLSFGFGGTKAQLARFFDALRIFSYQVNIGDVRSLIVNPTETTHAELTDRQLAEAGIRSETVRISVGLEDSADLIEDLRQALEAAFEE